MLYTRATRADLPSLTDIAFEAYENEPVYLYMKPDSLSYPTWSRSRFFLRLLDRVVLQSQGVCTVCKADKDGPPGFAEGTILGFAAYRRLTPAPKEHVQYWPQASWSTWVESKLRGWEAWYRNVFKIDPLIHANQSIYETQVKACFGRYNEITKEYGGMIWLGDITIRPSLRRRGIGQKLMEKMFDQADKEEMPIGLAATARGYPLYVANNFKVLFTETFGETEYPFMIRYPRGGEMRESDESDMYS